MFDITSRMILLLEKVPNGLTTAEIARIMGLSYDDASNVLAELRLNGIAIRYESSNGYIYYISPDYCENKDKGI